MSHLKTIFTFTFIIVTTLSKSQDFSFKMYFEDAIGNMDTLEFGYDKNATDTIDSIFGEVNLIGVPLDSMFDVRISDSYWNSGGPFKTKKQIVKNNDCIFSRIAIEIKCNNWPVTATWDNSVFNDTCRDGSVFTSILPGGWWDTGSPSDLWRVILNNQNKATFTSNHDIEHAINRNNGYYAYINDQNDTISMFWQAFGDSRLLWTRINDIKQDKLVNIFPNPVDSEILLETSDPVSIIKNIKLFDMLGNEQNVSIMENKINIKPLTPGTYILHIEFTNGQFERRKILKK